MPARSLGPWLWKGRGYYATIGGLRVNLKTKEIGQAWQEFYRLMGTAPPPGSLPSVSVLELVERFGDWAERHRKPQTAAYYDGRLKDFLAAFPAAATTKATDLRPFHVQGWIDSRKGWTSTTQKHAAAAVKRAYSWAVEQGLIEVDPIRSLKKARAQRRLRILSADEWATLLAGCPNEHIRAFLELQRFTGARPQELRLAEVRHFDRAGGCLRFPAEESKGGMARVIVLTEHAKRIVDRAIGGRTEGRILLNSEGYGWTRSGLRMAIRRLIASTGVKFTSYTGRHSYATDALANGVDAVTLGFLMGHVDPSMVARVYAHLDQKPAYLREAAEKAVADPKKRKR